MAKQYKVTFVELGVKMKDKFPGAYVSTMAVESGTKRKDFIFENSKQYETVKTLSKGDIIELKIVKKGDYFNLAQDDDAIKLIEKGGDSKESTIPSKTVSSYGTYKEDPAKQLAIIKQNALTNATSLVVAYLSAGKFPAKISLDIIADNVLSIAEKLAKFPTGEYKEQKVIEELEQEDPVQPETYDTEFGE